MEMLKKIYKRLLLVIAYTFVACLVYGYWFNYQWGKWYLTLMIIVIILIAASIIGYFYIKKLLKPNKEEVIEVKEENKEEINVTVENK